MQPVFLHFVVTSAHTLLGPFTLCLNQLYGVTVALLSSLCTHVPHFVVSSVHTLLGPYILMFRLVEQAGLSRATLEINPMNSSRISNDFPL